MFGCSQFGQTALQTAVSQGHSECEALIRAQLPNGGEESGFDPLGIVAGAIAFVVGGAVAVGSAAAEGVTSVGSAVADGVGEASSRARQGAGV